MRYVVIGGSGHVGTYLVPMLVRLGHEVINVSRGSRQPYEADPAWNSVKQVTANRGAEEADGSFGPKIAALQPDVVIDMICFTLDSAKHLVEALEGHVQHFISCGTIWVHGTPVEVPVTEEQPRRPFGDYGIEKEQIEAYLQLKARRDGFPATVLHPGHIVGPGWAPINPVGHIDPQVFVRLATGQPVTLPNYGLETLHHVHAEDVAQSFVKASQYWSQSIGQSFHIVSPAAVTLRGYAETVASWFGQEANLSYGPFEVLRQSISQDEAEVIWDHISRSPNCSIEKARRLIGYSPRYTSLEAVRESVNWLIAHKVIEI
ncbi:NAD-dependent epimerase/dehydratase family protein [Paenibacillus eucommiae]|uniref:Nucleoside-diphosphate-sugar epimerase n=1 Tax=Paenibacillus eucommiae TaxID=1355755 RepID=A0ABS4J0T4_9BACL|nr:NAD-dependent epimerase/dehydratase family protein [Paenibacillus eucommiae]MBP1993405.1 nucleoside-diphosphate-sugar epimerase [Paenibacillus eucommiae]